MSLDPLLALRCQVLLFVANGCHHCRALPTHLVSSQGNNYNYIKITKHNTKQKTARATIAYRDVRTSLLERQLFERFWHNLSVDGASYLIRKQAKSNDLRANSVGPKHLIFLQLLVKSEMQLMYNYRTIEQPTNSAGFNY